MLSLKFQTIKSVALALKSSIEAELATSGGGHGGGLQECCKKSMSSLKYDSRFGSKVSPSSPLTII